MKKVTVKEMIGTEFKRLLKFSGFKNKIIFGLRLILSLFTIKEYFESVNAINADEDLYKTFKRYQKDINDWK